jgi:exopolysaccharide biosynthesis WecB/TagA/CpsF family protein
VENGAIILPISVMQEATGNQGRINFVDIRLTPNTPKQTVEELGKQIQVIFPEGRARDASDVVSANQGFRIARAMSWSTSLLAIVVGVLGVMNTMLMTVFERTHEIGILLAVGFAFDVNAGTKPDAPAWMQRAGLTWAYRLATEPRRLAIRYLKWNSLFLYYLLKTKGP